MKITAAASRRCIGAMLLAVAARHAAAQSAGAVDSRPGLDRFQIVSLGASAGRVVPSQVEPTDVVAVAADYGQIAPNWHVVVNASYWTSAYRAAVVQEFVNALNQSLSGGDGNELTPSKISVYDVTFGAGARYTPDYGGMVEPFLGLGLAAHIINAEGKLINGTFVERALDDVAVGAYATTGLSFRIVKHLGVEGSVRGDLLSGFRSVQARIGATYFFGGVHSPRPTG